MIKAYSHQKRWMEYERTERFQSVHQRFSTKDGHHHRRKHPFAAKGNFCPGVAWCLNAKKVTEIGTGRAPRVRRRTRVGATSDGPEHLFATICGNLKFGGRQRWHGERRNARHATGQNEGVVSALSRGRRPRWRRRPFHLSPPARPG